MWIFLLSLAVILFLLALWCFRCDEDIGVIPMTLSILLFIPTSIYFGRDQKTEYVAPYELVKSETCLIVMYRENSTPIRITDISMWKNADKLVVKRVSGKNLWGFDGIASEELIVHTLEK